MTDAEAWELMVNCMGTQTIDWKGATAVCIERPCDAGEVARAIEARSGVNAQLVDALRSCLSLAWEDSREVKFDDTVMFGIGYDFFGWESLRMEIHTPVGSWAVWRNNDKFSAYGGPDGSMWFERFDTRAEAEEVVLRSIDKLCPTYPTSVARTALAAAGVKVKL